jgi:hypothetical protein
MGLMNFVRNHAACLVGMICAAMFLGGCAKSFIARDVYYDNTSDTVTEKTEVALVALSQDEYQSVGKSGKPAAERSAEFRRKLGNEWRDRSVIVPLLGSIETHRIVGKDDPVWKRFKAATDPKGNPTEWCALIVISKNWKDGDRWSAAYRGAPEDEIPSDRPAVTFKWTLDKPDGAGAPVCLSKQDGSAQ